MPDRRRHRGPHPRDKALFAASQLPRLQQATTEFSWLLDQGYADVAALKLVGDHHQLQRRQRQAVARSACTEDAVRARVAGTRSSSGQAVVADAFNLLITIETALSGGVLLRGADERIRDLAGVHGTWRSVSETAPALDALARVLGDADSVHWVIDRPVSNSGRLAAALRERGWTAELADDADGRLVVLAGQGDGPLLASADGPLMDRVLAAGGGLCDPVWPLVASVAGAWIAPMGAAGFNPGSQP